MVGSNAIPPYKKFTKGYLSMFENWVSLVDNIGKVGSENGIIEIDEELPELSRITFEKKKARYPIGDHYAVTMGVYGLLVHTAFFKRKQDAKECADSLKLVIEILLKYS
jgi:hypothetical protein